jgi:ubiquinone/menaquinone biosynthesis C-methylase UbiE
MDEAPRTFDAVAADYAAFRPTYPDALFARLARESPARDLAWDCATGNGQAAVALAAHFDAVIATDVSAAQLAHARPHPRVRYAVAPAEASPLDDDAADLVTVAQAFHWFDRDAFFAEVGRVLRPGGLLAVWTYGLFECTPDVDRVVARYVDEALGPYWSPARRLVDEGYAGVAFPFAPVAVPAFAMEARWTLDQLVGYLATWSARQTRLAATGTDPLPAVRDALAAVWGTPAATRPIRWPLAVHVRRKPR